MERPPSAPVSGRLTAALTGAAVVVALAGAVVAAAYDRAGTAAFDGTLAVALAIGAIAVVGAVITLTVPGNRVGWLLLAAAALMGVGGAFTEAGIPWHSHRPRISARCRLPGCHRAGIA